MTEQAQVQLQMEDLQLGDKYNETLKTVYTTLDAMTKDNYGMKDDEFYIPPLVCKKELVDKLQLQRSKQKLELHQAISIQLKSLLKLRRSIEAHQQTNYRWAVTKKRNKKYEKSESSRKKMKLDQTKATQKRRQEASQVEDYNIEEFNDDSGPDDLEEFNLSWWLHETYQKNILINIKELVGFDANSS